MAHIQEFYNLIQFLTKNNDEEESTKKSPCQIASSTLNTPRELSFCNEPHCDVGDTFSKNKSMEMIEEIEKKVKNFPLVDWIPYGCQFTDYVIQFYLTVGLGVPTTCA